MIKFKNLFIFFVIIFSKFFFMYFFEVNYINVGFVYRFDVFYFGVDFEGRRFVDFGDRYFVFRLDFVYKVVVSVYNYCVWSLIRRYVICIKYKNIS